MTPDSDTPIAEAAPRRRLRGLRVVAACLLVGLCLTLIVRQAIQQREAIRTLDWHFGWRSVCAVGLIMLAQFAVAMIVHTYLLAMHSRVARRQVLIVYLMSQASKYLPIGGLLNLVAQTGGLARIPEVGVKRGFLAILLGVATVCSCGAMWFGATGLFGSLGPVWLPAVCVAALPVFAVALRWPLTWNLLMRVTNARRGVDDEEPARPAPPSGGKLVLTSALGLGAWIAFGGSLALIAGELGPLSFDASLRVSGAMAGAWVLGFLSVIVPAGLGVRDAALMVLLQPIVAAPGPVVIPLVSRLLWTVADALNVLVAAVLARRLPKTQATDANGIRQ